MCHMLCYCCAILQVNMLPVFDADNAESWEYIHPADVPG
jgi:hypothetical protein